MVQVINMIPKSLSFERGHDREPNLAVNPANPQQIAASAFTRDPFGGPNAPIFVSTDGGNAWNLNSIVPSQGGSSTGDITLRFATTGNHLYAGILRRPGSLRLNILRTDDFTNPAPMTVLEDREGVDQPYIQAATVSSGPGAGADRVYVGLNEFSMRAGNGGNGRTATIDQALDGVNAPTAPPPPPSGFTHDRLERRATVGQNGPQIRPVIHPDGTVYGIFYGWRGDNGITLVSDVVVVRDDDWGNGPNPFTALTDSGDGKVGQRVVTGRSVPFEDFGLGPDRIGGDLSIAVDPNNSSTVYILWADRVGANDYTLHVRRSTDRGVTWSANDLRTVTNAKNGALAINSAGTVALLYQAFIGGANPRWVTHLERTTDAFGSKTDLVLADTPADQPPQSALSPILPYLGDYCDLTAVGTDFCGVFSASNIPNNANFPQGVTYQRNANFTTQTLLNLDGVTPVQVSIDPFFFRVS
jgi:hypothetical protein